MQPPDHYAAQGAPHQCSTRLSSGVSVTDSPAFAPLGAPRVGAQGTFLPGWSQPTTAGDGLFLLGVGLPSWTCPWPGGNFLRSALPSTTPPTQSFPPGPFSQMSCLRQILEPSFLLIPFTSHRRHPQYNPCPSHAICVFASWRVQTNLLVITWDLICVRYCFIRWGSNGSQDSTQCHEAAANNRG